MDNTIEITQEVVETIEITVDNVTCECGAVFESHEIAVSKAKDTYGPNELSIKIPSHCCMQYIEIWDDIGSIEEEIETAQARIEKIKKDQAIAKLEASKLDFSPPCPQCNEPTFIKEEDKDKRRIETECINGHPIIIINTRGKRD